MYEKTYNSTNFLDKENNNKNVAKQKQKHTLDKTQKKSAKTTNDVIGHLEVVRETGSLLCRTALWDCFFWSNSDPVSCATLLQPIKEKIVFQKQSHNTIR